MILIHSPYIFRFTCIIPFYFCYDTTFKEWESHSLISKERGIERRNYSLDGWRERESICWVEEALKLVLERMIEITGTVDLSKFLKVLPGFPSGRNRCGIGFLFAREKIVGFPAKEASPSRIPLFVLFIIRARGFYSLDLYIYIHMQTYNACMCIPQWSNEIDLF